MKIFLMILIFSFSAFAEDIDVTGTWALSGVGCRDYNLSTGSHVSKYVSDGFDGVEAAVMWFESDGKVEMNAVIYGKPKNRKGNYTIREDGKVVIDKMFKLNMIDSSLVVRGGDEESLSACGQNQTFVYVLDRV